MNMEPRLRHFCRHFLKKRCIRNLSTAGDGGSSNFAFDRALKIDQRDGAARAWGRWRREGPEDLVSYDYFREEIAYRMVDRLDDIRRDEGFPLVLEIGTNSRCKTQSMQPKNTN